MNMYEFSFSNIVAIPNSLAMGGTETQVTAWPGYASAVSHRYTTITP